MKKLVFLIGGVFLLSFNVSAYYRTWTTQIQYDCSTVSCNGYGQCVTNYRTCYATCYYTDNNGYITYNCR